MGLIGIKDSPDPLQLRRERIRYLNIFTLSRCLRPAFVKIAAVLSLIRVLYQITQSLHVYT